MRGPVVEEQARSWVRRFADRAGLAIGEAKAGETLDIRHFRRRLEGTDKESEDLVSFVQMSAYFPGPASLSPASDGGRSVADAVA